MIFGAGVSSEYGYPIGSKLVRNLKSALDRQGHRTHAKILQDLNAINPYSIDYFLYRKPNHSEIIKQLLIQHLLDVEANNFDFIREVSDGNGGVVEKDTFYKMLFNILPVEKYDRLTVITFNYDRSFEGYFLKALMALYAETLEQAYERFKKIKVIHVYGRLPALGRNIEQEHGILINSPNDFWGCPYGDYPRHKSMESNIAKFAIERLFTVHEDGNKQTTSFGENLYFIYRAISDAKRIFFLGFGYHDLNMEILGFKESHLFKAHFDSEYRSELKKKTIAGTAQGLGGVEIRRISKTYGIHKLINCNNLEFFYNFYSLLNKEWDH